MGLSLVVIWTDSWRLSTTRRQRWAAPAPSLVRNCPGRQQQLLDVFVDRWKRRDTKPWEDIKNIVTWKGFDEFEKWFLMYKWDFIKKTTLLLRIIEVTHYWYHSDICRTLTQHEMRSSKHFFILHAANTSILVIM